jgi:hypothetical protein
MGTSRSSSNLLYGWTTSEYVGDGMLAYTDYVNEQNSTSYGAVSDLYYYYTTSTTSNNAFSFDIFKTQIKQNHPMVFVVDSSGDGEPDHGVAAVGYRETNGYPEYACWDTWHTDSIQWKKFQPAASGNSYGIKLAIGYEIVSEPEEDTSDSGDDDDDTTDGTGCSGLGMIVLLMTFSGFAFVSTTRKP